MNESTEDSTQLFADFPAKSLPIPKPSSVANLPSPAETVPKTESLMLNGGRSGRGQAAHTTPDGTIIAQGSCHQCKIKLPASRLVFCTVPRGATMHCQKKYCHGCLQRKYGISETRIPDLSQWKCPACQGFCTCAQCMRKAMKGLPTSAPTASCHQCKLKKPHEALRVCNAHSGKGRRCKKKFCQSCLAKYGDTFIACDGSDGHWACPACRGVCNCARCRRSRGDKGKRVVIPALKEAPADKGGQSPKYPHMRFPPQVFHSTASSSMCAPVSMSPIFAPQSPSSTRVGEFDLSIQELLPSAEGGITI